MNYRLYPALKKALAVAAICTFSLISRPAWADRIVYFDVTGLNQVSVNNATYAPKALGLTATNINSKCVITITNSGPSDQAYVLTISGSSDYGSGRNGSVSNVSATSATAAPTTSSPISGVLSPNGQVIATWGFLSPLADTVMTENIRCWGSIKVSDSDATNPGFVTANGLLITWMQAGLQVQSNGQPTFNNRVQVNNVTTPFTIGEGRAF